MAADASTRVVPRPAVVSGDAAAAARLGIVSARPGVRAWAFTIDVLLWLALAIPAGIGAWLLSLGDISWGPILLLVVGLVLPSVFGLVQLITHGRRGVTAGKASMRLRSVSMRDLGRPGFWRIVLRALVLAVSGVVPVAGPAVLLGSSLWDGERRGRSILDKVAGCWLVDVRAGLDPADARALRRAIRELEMPLREVSEGLPSLATVAAGERPVLADRRSRAAVVGISGGPWSEPPAPAPGAIIADVPRSAFHLVFEDGSTVPVPAFGLVGRLPEAGAGQRADVLLTLEDPQRLLSKTHLAFGADADGVWVADQGSSNGTVVVAPSGVESAIEAGARTALEPGTVVRVGGRMFQVRSGSPTA
jgi:uncharacterized RDD family membrane protein YckC